MNAPSHVKQGVRVALCASDVSLRERIETTLVLGGHEIAASCESLQGLREARALGFDVAVVKLPDELFAHNGGAAMLRAHLGELPLVVVASNLRRARKLVRANVDGVVEELQIEAALLHVIDAVLANQLCVPSSMRDALAGPVFSHREKQTLQLVLAGLTNGEIASRLYLSESTVKSHLASSFRKLGVSSRAEAARRVLDPDLGLELTPPSPEWTAAPKSSSSVA